MADNEKKRKECRELHELLQRHCPFTCKNPRRILSPEIPRELADKTTRYSSLLEYEGIRDLVLLMRMSCLQPSLLLHNLID